MIDSVTLGQSLGQCMGQSLAGLLEAGSNERDWDTSALADWPNIIPTPTLHHNSGYISSATLLAADCDRAC